MKILCVREREIEVGVGDRRRSEPEEGREKNERDEKLVKCKKL